MTSWARIILVVATMGLVVGAVRRLTLLPLVCLSTLIWVLFEWLRLQWVVRVALPTVQLRRTVNGHGGPTGVVWQGRPVTVRVQIQSRYLPGELWSFADATSEMLRAARQPSVDEQDRSLAHDVTAISSTPSETPRRRANGEYEMWLEYRATPLGAGRVTWPGVTFHWKSPFRLFEYQAQLPARQVFRVLPEFDRSVETQATIKRHNALPTHGIHRTLRAGAGSELLELREYVPGDPPKSIAWKASARRDQLMTRQYESEVPVRVHLIIDRCFETRSGPFGERMIDQINSLAATIGRAAISAGDPVRATFVDERITRRLPWLMGDLGHLQLLGALADECSGPPASVPEMTVDMFDALIACVRRRTPAWWREELLWSPTLARPRTRRRFRFAQLLATLYRLPLAQQYRACVSDEVLTQCASRWLADSEVSWTPPFYQSVSPPRTADAAYGPAGYASTFHIAALRDALGHAVGTAQDTELLVLMAPLSVLTAAISQLRPTIKLALARRHRMVIVAPTPTGVRPPQEPMAARGASLSELVEVAEVARTRYQFKQLKRELASLQALVTLAADQTALRRILQEIDRAQRGTRRAAAPAG